jgi:glucose/arabinose dehydrogenase
LVVKVKVAGEVFALKMTGILINNSNIHYTFFMIRSIFSIAVTSLFILSACASPQQKQPVTNSTIQADSLPDPTESHRNFSKVIGWKAGEAPTAPQGFTVSKFAANLKNPRWIYQAPNGDIFVAESGTRESANHIRLFRDADNNGSYESTYIYAAELNQPLGILVLNGKFYIACTDGLYMYPYIAADTMLKAAPKKIVALPAGGYNNHWTRNIIANTAGTKIYITVGSGSNVAEHGIKNEVRRANILEVNPDGSGEKVYASGLRNPVGMDWEPVTQTLWTAVNERDELGDDLVPDYATGIKEGAFYGWPWSYFGQHVDPRMKNDPRPDMVAKAIVPDVSLGAHTASLGLAFYTKTNFPAHYRGGMFIGQHGSWNRSDLVGYRVVFVPFKNGMPAGKPEDFLTGFILPESKREVHGRPVGVTVLKDGSLLVADDSANCIWKVTAK